MPTTDTSEKGLETLVVAALTSRAGYEAGDPQDYDRVQLEYWNCTQSVYT